MTACRYKYLNSKYTYMYMCVSVCVCVCAKSSCKHEHVHGNDVAAIARNTIFMHMYESLCICFMHMYENTKIYAHIHLARPLFNPSLWRIRGLKRPIQRNTRRKCRYMYVCVCVCVCMYVEESME